MKTGWDDLALFAAVAHAGSLGPAAGETGVSVATLSRRMKALEARLGRRLFLHGKGGYAVTAAGRALLEKVGRMEATAAEIGAWQAEAQGPVRVRISAGTWTALRLATHLPEYWSPAAPWVPEFVHCNRDLDIARREIDIGVRNRRPDQPWLAGRRTGAVTFAAYAADPAAETWIGGNPETAPLPSERWVAENHPNAVRTTANDPALRLAMAEAGLGRVVLPTFIGDIRPGLSRVGGIIDALTSEEWLVAHHEARHETPIRAALDALARFLARPRTAAA